MLSSMTLLLQSAAFEGAQHAQHDAMAASVMSCHDLPIMDYFQTSVCQAVVCGCNSLRLSMPRPDLCTK